MAAKSIEKDRMTYQTDVYISAAATRAVLTGRSVREIIHIMHPVQGPSCVSIMKRGIMSL